MTPGQKKNIERLKKAASEAKKIRKQNPKLSQGEAMKKAFAVLGASKPVTKKSTKPMAKKSVTKKPATRTKIHKDTKSHNVNIRVVSGVPTYADVEMARELQLYADNDSQLYYQRRLPIVKNLQTKYKKGTFAIDKAAKLWRYYIDAALEKYNKEFSTRGTKWFSLLSVADRNLLAREYAIATKNEFDNGEFID